MSPFVSLITASLAMAASGSGQSWEKVRAKDGVAVWTRPSPGSDLVEMRAETVLPTSAPAVWAVLSEPHRFDSFMPYTLQTRLLERHESGLVVYIVTDPPVVSRRDVTVSYTKRVDESRGLYRLEFREANGKAPRLPDGVVRMTRMRGQWMVKAIDAKRCRVRYQVHAEPGGLVPAFLANAQASGALTDVLVRLRARVVARDGKQPG